MFILKTLIDLVARLPELALLIPCPAILLVVGLILAIFHKRNAYYPLAIALGGAGFFLVSCVNLSLAFMYLALYVVFAVLVWLLFLIPFGGRRSGNIQEELYERFHVGLDIPEEELFAESEGTYDSEESGLRLAHVTMLVEQLKKTDLAPGDRLEVDALSHTLDGYRDRVLTENEMRALNDCLATVLKLTAKYKL